MATTDDGYRLLACEYLRPQVERLPGRLEGCIRGRDPEDVHQARVASRRLRSGLRMFRRCLPARQRKRWRKEVSRLRKSLGPARDADVQGQFVETFLAGLEQRPARAGVRRLLVRLRQRRRRLQKVVVRAVGRVRQSGVLEEMRQVFREMEADLHGREVTIRTPLVFLRAERLILRRLEGLLAGQESLADPADVPGHHAMRIAVKRLRYTMEICRPIYEGRLDEFLAAVKQLQTLLGEIHDCDVWAEELDRFMEAERKRTAEYYGTARPFRRLAVGLEYLREDRRRRREELFAGLTDCWRRLSEEGTWNRLAGLVLEAVQPAGSPPSGAGEGQAPTEPGSAAADGGQVLPESAADEGEARQPAPEASAGENPLFDGQEVPAAERQTHPPAEAESPPPDAPPAGAE